MKTQGPGGTRTKILDVARELFATHGYAGTSISDIVGRLGTTKGSLYYHFPSKDAILDAIVAEPADALTAIIEAAEATPPPPAAQTLGALIDLQGRYPAAYLAFYAGEGPLLQKYSKRHNLEDRTERIIAALARPDPPTTGRLVRARAAVGAVKDGAVTALRLHGGVIPPGIRDEILSAALGALGDPKPFPLP
ncbi:TetR/AcrR family transcriptional regulator [Frankia sp. AgB32]|uniref:TetR/AcrR family transcriptional regulator n=1 Tax=Frankia sp. AgB32 TaxID=631119 RepID=UPI00200F660F|nr:TetR/AcrR family transcriptional regulator [Frankia sp. AgB32]MCK9897086.1 TetR/AcrR family transcriptional regulator [Frankia sp. AgB32]